VEPALTVAYALAQDFVSMLRERQGHHLDAWIAQALADDKAELRGFATGLLPYKATVETGLTLPWSTGPCEGQIHKVKLNKRSISGADRRSRTTYRVGLTSACMSLW
jgi:transposase